MKQLNEIKRMQQLDGLIKENFEDNSNEDNINDDYLDDDRYDVLAKTLVNLPLEDFIKVIKAVGDYEIWMDGAKQMGTNLDDKSFRAQTIDAFEDDDVERYNQVLQINELKRIQQLAGILKEELEPNFELKAKSFINKHISIIKDAVKFYKNKPDDYEDSLIQTIYNFFEKELGEDWTTQIATPDPEDEKDYTYGWTDEKDEVFYNALKSILK